MRVTEPVGVGAPAAGVAVAVTVTEVAAVGEAGVVLTASVGATCVDCTARISSALPLGIIQRCPGGRDCGPRMAPL